MSVEEGFIWGLSAGFPTLISDAGCLLWVPVDSRENWPRQQPICLCEQHADKMSLLVAAGTRCQRMLCGAGTFSSESFPTTPAGAKQYCPQTWKARGSISILILVMVWSVLNREQLKSVSKKSKLKRPVSFTSMALGNSIITLGFDGCF